jgi:hypothetical protein
LVLLKICLLNLDKLILQKADQLIDKNEVLPLFP